MGVEMSVFEKATRLRAVAHTYAEGAKERRDREQAELALKEVEDALDALVKLTEAARSAAELGVTLPEMASLVGRGLTNLEARSAGGLLPTKQALQAAKGRLISNRAELETAFGAAWRAWATARVREVPIAKIALVASRMSRQSIEDDLRSLHGMTRSIPTAREVQAFGQKWKRVRDVLDALEAEDDMVELLTRLGASEGVLLADLSDSELALLRNRVAVAEQIVLRRR
ncbi:hypothetical protein [Sinomonas terrae]|uniref:Uncharacterized protein n=1 Tax=Sinomonas terrae TaxID=2908838 RepID=A0ABS9U2G1_9MICC|nr:hypothetical protein [Sinomonas terrae]MCH6470687.1 hypothetical protein [Sinomonas terrae]